jgi:hypothetical protein
MNAYLHSSPGAAWTRNKRSGKNTEQKLIRLSYATLCILRALHITKLGDFAEKCKILMKIAHDLNEITRY